MHDWAAISKTFAAFRESYSRPEARVRLEALLGVKLGSDLSEVHAALRALLRSDVEATLAELGLRDGRVLAWLDQDERAMYSLSLTEELKRLANAAIIDPHTKRKLAAHADRLRAPAQTTQPLLDSIVPPSRQYIGDAESVGAARDYEDVVRDLLAIAKVRASQVICTETGETRQLVVRAGRRTANAELRGNTDWIDPPPLLACLNAVLPVRSTRRFCQVVLPEWGQELGVVLASSAELAQLRKARLLEDQDADDDTDDEA